MHVLAEQVLSAARYRATERIGLRPTPGGFGTPRYGGDEEVRVDGVELVHRVGGEEQRQPITSPRAAAEFVGVPLGAPPVYTAATHADPDAPLEVEAEGVAALATWFAVVDAALTALRRQHPDDSPTGAQLWPEHFDLAIELGDEDAGVRANYGGSPGDTTIAAPYLYVGPWQEARRAGRFAAYPFGAVSTYEELGATADPAAAAREFFEACASELLRGPG
jgi:hypothetical protein